MFRILQESLTNVARHAKATTVQVKVSVDDKEANLDIRDNGKGIRPDKLHARDSWGIIGMKERVKGLNGNLAIRGNPRKGTLLKVTLPLNRRRTIDE